MKSSRIKFIFVGVIMVTALIIQSCKEDDFPVPTASSQAKFTYEVSIIEVEGESVFEVHFTNQSILANSYFWDFGNGNTSTQENPTEVFSNQGDYAVTLTITSINVLHYNKLVYSANLRLLLKESLLLEPFDGEGATTPESWLPEGWLTIDADGDAINWYWGARQGNGQMRSESWNDVPLTPNNWLVTPEIDLTSVETGVEVWLNFNVCPTANTAIYRTEHYGVFVSTTGANPTDFTEKIWEETLLETMTNWVYEFREIDLTQFAGQKVRIGFRHYESSDKDRVVIDDVEVFKKF